MIMFDMVYPAWYLPNGSTDHKARVLGLVIDKTDRVLIHIRWPDSGEEYIPWDTVLTQGSLTR